MSFGYQILGFGSGGAAGPPVVSATGDAETTVGDYTVHSYTGSGNFTVTGGSLTCDILCVAGGGGGSSGPYGGGAGAGGMRTSESALLGSYTITVGAGGAEQTSHGTPYAGNKGVDSSVGSTVVSTGGAKGNNFARAGYDGGSGSGGTGGGSAGGSGNEGGYSPVEGYDGGAAIGAYGQGAGGGASEVGGSAPSYQGGNGGDGVANAYRTGSNVTYAGGGGGSAFTYDVASSDNASICLGGSGGGGEGGQYWNGGNFVSTAGTANTGGGAGSCEGHAANDQVGKAGGSGIIVIRYLTAALSG